MAAGLLLLALLARPAGAHDYPIAPVSVVLRAEPDRLTADVDSDSIYWIEEVVGLHPMPPRDWPANALDKSEKYVNEHLRLNADGKLLRGRLVAASYVQRPWQVNEQGRFRLRLEYPPLGAAATLAGEADFFEDYRQERIENKEPMLPIMDFRTVLSIPGRVPRNFELKPGAIAFSLPAADARRGTFARFAESAGAGAGTAANAIEGWAALLALALSLAPGAPAPRRAALLLAAALAGAASWPAAAPAWLPWAAGLAAAVSAGRWLGAGAAPWLEAAAAAALFRSWSAQSLVWLPRAVPGAFERSAAAAGMLLTAAAALAAGLLLAESERRRLAAHSKARAAELFDRRRRLSATVLVLVCGYGLYSGLAR